MWHRLKEDLDSIQLLQGQRFHPVIQVWPRLRLPCFSTDCVVNGSDTSTNSLRDIVCGGLVRRIPKTNPNDVSKLNIIRMAFGYRNLDVIEIDGYGNQRPTFHWRHINIPHGFWCHHILTFKPGFYDIIYRLRSKLKKQVFDIKGRQLIRVDHIVGAVPNDLLDGILDFGGITTLLCHQE